MIRSSTAVSEGLSSRFASDGGLYGSLEDVPLIAQKGHYRRMELLNMLDVGDVSDKVCVDFGTGSWGFACIYPRLHACKFAYGIDISKKALELSAKLSREGNFPYGSNFDYLQSDGLELPLSTESADVIFSGESIEHVRFPKRFLAECYRVLRLDGQLIITTPNRDALLYKVQGDQYCVGPEHFWLFNTEELRETVGEFFEVAEFLGFNGSIYRDLDDTSTDPTATEEWSKLFRNNPEFATGIIMRAVKRSTRMPPRYSMELIDPNDIRVKGQYQMLDLEFGLKGKMIDSPESSITFVCRPCDGVVMHFWSHAWSGIAQVSCGNQTHEFNLYTKDPGWKPIHSVLRSERHIPIEIRATCRRDDRALAAQTIFFEAFTYVT